MKTKRTMTATGYQNLIVVLLVLILGAVMAVLSDKFLTYSNFLNIMTQASLTIMCGCAITNIIISGNFDLSIGGMMALASVLYAYFCRAGAGIFLSLLIAVAACTLFGFLNGILVTRLDVPSFISTMGVMYITRGIAYVMSKGTVIGTGLPFNFTHIGVKTLLGVPLPVIYTLVIFFIMLFIQLKTVFGRKVYAIGANPTASRLSGINSKGITVALYVISGLIAGFSSVVYTSRIAVGDCQIGQGFEFQVIIACVLGGTDVNGGRGSLIGMFFGAILIRILGNGLNILGIMSYWQSFINGIVLVGAVILNRYIIKFAETRAIRAKGA